MHRKLSALFIFLLFTTNLSTIYASPQHPRKANIETIVFLRHGEKPLVSLGQLNCRGFNRALALPLKLDEKFGQPDFIFAPLPYYRQSGAGVYYYVRPLVTIEPTAIQYGMPVSTDFEFFEVNNIAKALISEDYHQSLLFVAWEHLNIVYIAKRIMTLLDNNPKQIPAWPEKDFDSLYILQIDWSKKPVTVKFTHDHEGLDGQSDVCPSGYRTPICEPPPPQQQALTHQPALQNYIIIPEAEVRARQFDQLSCRGFNRALALNDVLHDTFHTFDLFVVPVPDKTDEPPKKLIMGYIRTLMTVEPTILTTCAMFKVPKGPQTTKSMAKYLTSDKSLFQFNLYLAWPATEIPLLAKEIYQTYGGNPDEIPSVKPDPDTIYQISVYRDQEKVVKATFTRVAEALNNRSDICPLPIPGQR